MLIVDSHLDLAWNALQWNRNLVQSVYTIRAQESGLKILNPGAGLAQGTVAFPEMREGRVALSFATLLARSTGRLVPNLDYATPEQAYGIALGQRAYYQALASQGCLRIITDRAGLDTHLAEWQTWDAAADPDPTRAPALGIVISMESADAILYPDQLPEWWDAGVRVIGPAHYGPGRYAGGTGTESGLTGLGVELLAGMEKLGMILDVSHFSDTAFWQALERYHGTILASHNNCRALVPHQRQFSDVQIHAIVARQGVIGVALDAWMLQFGWINGQTDNRSVSLERVVDQIDYICQLAGNTRHAAIGSDLDGGYGREQAPHDLNTIADLQRLAGLLAARGYAQAEIAAILHGNWLDLLGRSRALRQDAVA